MATKKSTWVLFGILVISAWILGPSIQVGAETLNYKNYSYATKTESVPIGDVEGHSLNFSTRRGFSVFENGEVATYSSVLTGDTIKGSGPYIQYVTMTFSDGSTIIMKVQVTVTGAAPGAPVSATAKRTSEIIKGTGRFEGIKGTGTGTAKYLPVEEGEAGAKGISENSITYTLPSQ
jgi:hypothetical protein